MLKRLCGPLLIVSVSTIGILGCGSTPIPNAQQGKRFVSTPFLYVELAGAGPLEGFPAAGAILGYTVNGNGQLQPISNFSPIQGFGGVVSGNYLFSGDPNGTQIDSYRIGNDGSLTRVQSADDPMPTGCVCHLIGPFLADHAGTSLYAWLYEQNLGVITQSFSVDRDTGALNYRSEIADSVDVGGSLQVQAFSGDDRYAFGTYSDATPPYNHIAFLARSADGALTGNPEGNPVVAAPTPPPGIVYGESLIGTDTTSHAVAFLNSLYPSGQPTSLPLRLASFSIQSDGSLTSSNTNDDMPTVSRAPGVVSVSPDGTLVAIDQPGGFQLFHFNGAAPLTVFTPVIPTTEEIDQFAWDNQGHLFALSSQGELYVFSISSSGALQAQGSPYSIQGALGLMVQPGQP